MSQGRKESFKLQQVAKLEMEISKKVEQLKQMTDDHKQKPMNELSSMFLGPKSLYLKQDLDPFSRFCQSENRVKPRDRQTNIGTLVTIFCISCIRCGLKLPESNARIRIQTVL